MDTDERFMREALREAAAARDEDEIPVGAVVVWKGRIIAKGTPEDIQNNPEQAKGTTIRVRYKGKNDQGYHQFELVK